MNYFKKMTYNLVISVIGAGLISCTSSTTPITEDACLSSVSSDKKPVLSLGGVVSLESPSGRSSNCTAVFNFFSLGEKATVEVTTARHCVDPSEGEVVTLRPFDGTGYLNIPATSEYVSHLGIVTDIVKKSGLDPLLNGLFSRKRSSQIFSTYTNDGRTDASIKALSKQLKQETLALGSPFCSTVENKSSEMSRGNDLKACFLYTDLVKFNTVANIDERSKIALFRAEKLGAGLSFKSSSSPALNEWNVLLANQTALEVESLATSIQYAASICDGTFEVNSKLDIPDRFCNEREAIRSKLLNNGIIKKDKRSQLDFLTDSVAQAFVHEKFEVMLRKWRQIKSNIYNENFILMGNNRNSETSKFAFGQMYLHNVPSKLPNIHRGYGVISHFDKSKVVIEKGSSGSMLVVDGTVLALLSSVDGSDTTSGIDIAGLPASKDIKEIVPEMATSAPISSVGPPLEAITPDVQVDPANTIINPNEIPGSYTQVSANCR